MRWISYATLQLSVLLYFAEQAGQPRVAFGNYFPALTNDPVRENKKPNALQILALARSNSHIRLVVILSISFD